MREELDTTAVSPRVGAPNLIALGRRFDRLGLNVESGAMPDASDVRGVQLVHGDEPLVPGAIVLAAGGADQPWSLIPRAGAAGAAALVIGRTWPGERSPLLMALAQRHRVNLLTCDPMIDRDELRSSISRACAEATSGARNLSQPMWGPSTVLSLLLGEPLDVPAEELAEPGSAVLAFTPLQPTVAGPAEEALDRAIWLVMLDPDVPTDAEGVRHHGVAFVLLRRRRTEQELRAIAEHIRQLLALALDRSVLASIGAPADDPARICDSREEAERVLSLARRRTSPGTTTLNDVRHLALLDEAAAVLSAQPHLLSEKLAALRRSDSARNTSYVAVLRAFLDNFGDVNTSAERLGMHHNTFRYRLKRAVEVSGIVLEDPAERLALQVELAIGD